jgi:hypothetical protein
MNGDARYNNNFRNHDVVWENGRCVRRPKKVMKSATSKAADVLMALLALLAIAFPLLVIYNGL